MSAETQAVLYNAVPLLVLAALYFVVTAALAPSFLRERARLRDVDFATALIFPCVGVAAAIAAVLVLVDREPMVSYPVIFILAIAIACLPAIAFFASWKQRSLALAGASRAREAEGQRSARERELDAVSRLSLGLVAAGDEATVGGLLVAEACEVLDLEIASLAVVDEGAATARFVEARKRGVKLDWLTGRTIDLRNEPSGVASVVATGEPFAVVDAPASPRVSAELVGRLGIRSAAFVPLRTPERVAGVLVAASETPRVFGLEELELLQALAGEGALAIQRIRSALALHEALERERLIARIGVDMRSALDLDAVLDVTVRQLGVALGLSRCFVRLGEPLAAEWSAERLEPVGADASDLPVTNLAQAARRTVAVADVETAVDLEPAARERLLALGSRSALATPIDVGGETTGVLALHRSQPGAWPEGAVALAEAVAQEAGLAIRTARLLEENRRRLAEQSALLDASQALTSELHVDAVLQRIVDELSRLLGADAADCWIFDEHSGRLRCRAVRGLPETGLGRAILPEGTVATAIETRQPQLKRRFAETEEPPPSATYAAFAETMDAPIATGGDVRGVLGVCSLEHDRFDENDLRLLDAFARLAAIALRNAESFEESTRRAQVQQGFFRIASVLGEPLSAASTLDAVAQAAAEALGGDAAVLLRPVAGRLELAGSYEVRPELEKLLSSGGGLDTLELAAAEQRVLAAPQLADDERFAGWHEALAAADASSLLAIPVQEARGQRGGLVVVLFTEERAFSDDDLELVRQLATAARGALERSELYELERRARSLAQHLASTGRTLTTELDPAVVLDEIPRQATRLLETDGSSVRLLEGDELVLHAAVGPASTSVLGARTPSTASLAGDIVQSREPVTISDVGADERHSDADPLLAAGQYRAYAGVPLIGPEGNVYGVLAAVSSRPREWRQEEVDALLALAGNASTALANAELYQRVAFEKGQSEAILANVADGIVAVDREGAVVLWNAAAERITGVPASEALGRQPEQAIGRALSVQEAALPGRLLAIRRGSEDVWLSLTETVMTDPAGAVSGRIFAFRDISAERAVEEMKSEFVSTVSHELRTPLTSIYGFAETLLREDVQFGDEERRTFLRYMASESERLTTIVDTLLSVARLEGGDLQLRLAATDVAAVVSEAVRNVEATHGGNGYLFVAELPDEPLDAEADRDKLRQVLAILLENAVRYSPGGGRVVVGARLVQDAVELSVADEGVGIPAAMQAHIFRKFYRGDSNSEDVGTGNTGLGLFIAEGLVHAMGGRIWVDSTEGQGSTFGVVLPRAATETRRGRVETPGSQP